MPLIVTRSLHKRYGEKEVLKDINLNVEKGEVFVLIGPTGGGKTTLLRLLDLLEAPTSGRIYFDGIDITGPGKTRLEARRRMAFVLQKPVVFNTSVYDNVACGLKWRGIDNSSIHQKVDSVLEMVGLSDYKNRNARTLSGGEAQQVAIARAMTIEPEVLLLDEPTANLDPISTSGIERLISQIIHQHRTTIVMSTHDRSQGHHLADRMAVLVNGEVLQTGDPGETFNSPRNREVAEFVGTENIWDGVIMSNEEGIVTIDTGGKVMEAVSDYTAGEKIYACVRPENITLALSMATTSARNSFTGEIARITSLGPLTRVEIDCGFRLVALVTKRSAEELNLENGKEVYATFKATGVHIIRKEND